MTLTVFHPISSALQVGVFKRLTYKNYVISSCAAILVTFSTLPDLIDLSYQCYVTGINHNVPDYVLS